MLRRRRIKDTELRRTLPFLLILALMLSACSGADDSDSTTSDEDTATEDTATEDTAADDAAAEDTATDEAAADGEAVEFTDAEIEAAVDQAIVEVFCENTNGFIAAYNDFEAAEVGSEEETAAVDEMEQLGREIEVLAAEDLPELVTSLQTVHGAAVDFVNGDSATLDSPEGQAAVETIDSAASACSELGLTSGSRSAGGSAG